MCDLTVSLIAIQSGSECLTFALTGEVMFGAGLLSKAHSTSDYSQIPTRAHDALHRISSQAVKNSWTVEFVEDRYNNIRSAIISQEHPVPPPAHSNSQRRHYHLRSSNPRGRRSPPWDAGAVRWQLPLHRSDRGDGPFGLPPGNDFTRMLALKGRRLGELTHWRWLTSLRKELQRINRTRITSSRLLRLPPKLPGTDGGVSMLTGSSRSCGEGASHDLPRYSRSDMGRGGLASEPRDEVRRAERYIRWLRMKDKRAMIPAPVLAESPCRGDGNGTT